MIASAVIANPFVAPTVLHAICLSDVDAKLLQGPMTYERLELEALIGRIARVRPEQWDAILARKLKG